MEQTLGNIIKTARLNAKLSQYKLAILCGTTHSCINYIELGKVKKPRITTLVNLSEQLNLELNTLMKKAGYALSPENDNIELSELIRTARLKANLSQVQLANLCGTCHSVLSYLENGRTKKLRFSTLVALSKHLNLDLEVLKKKAGYIP